MKIKSLIALQKARILNTKTLKYRTPYLGDPQMTRTLVKYAKRVLLESVHMKVRLFWESICRGNIHAQMEPITVPLVRWQ